MTTFAYSSFLTLTNRVLRKLNEVPLTSGNFSSAAGFQAVAQDAVNDAVRDINSVQYEWPFNHQYTTQLLTSGVQVYSLPDNCKTVDWDTFFLNRNDVLANPQRGLPIPYMDYNAYVQGIKADDVAMDSSQYASPRNVVRTQGMEFLITPPPDQAYTVAYEYWKSNVDMAAYGDSCAIPNLFDWVIVNGAMHYCYEFRENLEASTAAEKKFDDGVKYMRNIYGFNYTEVRDGRAGPQFNRRG